MTVAEIERTAIYSSPEVCALAGCSFRMLDYWCRSHDLFAPNGRGFGSGTRRRFSAADVKLARALSRLSEAGLMGGGLMLRDGLNRFADPIREAIAAGDCSVAFSPGRNVRVLVSWVTDDGSEP